MEPLPDRFGPYRVEGLLGRGGMGAVYSARHPDLPQPVALKTLEGADPQALARFEREALALGRVKHPGVVRVHALERDRSGQPYMVIERIEGRTLHELAAGRGLEWRQACGLVRELCAAVQAIHDAGVLHRDIKAENVMLRPEGRVVLLDFGLARHLDARSLTETGTLMGTPSCMAPEQAQGSKLGAIDARTDVYGLGALLYFLLCGRPPFLEAGLLATLDAVVHRPPDEAPLRARGVPAVVLRVLRSALAKAPDQRPPTASALGEALSGALQAPPRGVVRRGALAALCVLGGGGLAAAVALGAGRRGEPHAPPSASLPVVDEGSAAPRGSLPRWAQRNVPDLPSPGGARITRYQEVCDLLARPDLPAPLRERLERHREQLKRAPLAEVRIEAPLRLGHASFLNADRLLVYHERADGVTLLDLTAASLASARLELWPQEQQTGLAVARYGDGWVVARWWSTRVTFDVISDGSPPRLQPLGATDLGGDLPALPGTILEDGALLRCGALAPSGRLLALGGRARDVLLLDVDEPTRVRRLGPQQAMVSCLRFLDERRLAVGTEMPSERDFGGMTVQLWEGERPLGSPVKHLGSIVRLAAAPDGQQVAAGDGLGGLRLYSPSGEPRPLVAPREGVDGRDAVFEAILPEDSARAHLGSVEGLVWSQDGSRIYSLGGPLEQTSRRLREWDPVHARLLSTHSLAGTTGGEACDLALSPDDRLLAVCFRGGRVAILAAPRSP